MTEELKPCPCREAFEKWAEAETSASLERNSRLQDRYWEYVTQIAWTAWKAAWNTRHGEK